MACLQVSHFSGLAGKGADEGVMATNICKLLITPELASGLNWIGTDNKRGLKKLKTGELIIGMYLPATIVSIKKKILLYVQNTFRLPGPLLLLLFCCRCRCQAVSGIVPENESYLSYFNVAEESVALNHLCVLMSLWSFHFYCSIGIFFLSLLLMVLILKLYFISSQIMFLFEVFLSCLRLLYHFYVAMKFHLNWSNFLIIAIGGVNTSIVFYF